MLQGSKYLIERKVGQGGFGITYTGIQLGLNRQVAIKEFFMSDFCVRDQATDAVVTTNPNAIGIVETFKSKFFKEANIIAALSHQHIVKIIDVFTEHNTAYYVMEHIAGGSVADWVKANGPMSEEMAVEVITQVGQALSYIHSHNILHLDIKPSNIMIREKGDYVLIDFGVSKHYTPHGEQTTRSAVGISPGYAPIEQYNEGGVASFTPSTDVYSLGATLYFLVTGLTPPEATALVSQPLPPIRANVSQPVVECIHAAMNYAKEFRPATADKFLAMLQGERFDNNSATNKRATVEMLIARKEYKEAYRMCLTMVKQNVDVAYAQQQIDKLIPLMRSKNVKQNFWIYMLAIVAAILAFVIAVAVQLG